MNKEQKKILLQKLNCCYRRDYALDPFIRSYYKFLSRRLNGIIFAHIERVHNLPRNLTLNEKLEETCKIKSEIERIAQVNNPNNPHLGISREMAEETFYKIMGIYKHALKKESHYSIY